jgi:hypothetical protein
MVADTASGRHQEQPRYGAEASPDRPGSRPGDTTSVRSHLVEGRDWGGGHRHGTGRPGKAEFPAGWDDERTIGYIVDVARHPDTRPVWQPNHRWRLYGERDAVGVTVVVKPDGGIWAAWPEEGGPGVVRNPSGGRP